ncbi:MAG: hypothetical protein H0T98_01965 [Euzebyaceae bacterium]|nr:hypothetical protein [Euzebyaceae bacterium]
MPWSSPRAPRLLFLTPRSDLRLSWHSDRDRFIVSLWRDQECVASAPLAPADSAEVASFIVTHLAGRTSWGPRLVTAALPERRQRRHLRSWADALRRLVGSN